MLVLLLVFSGCTGKDSGPVITKQIRPLNHPEFVIWELAINCFINSKIEPFITMEYLEPQIIVIPDVSGSKACGREVSACARLEDNTVVIKEVFYYQGWGINKTLIVHEFKHIILFQAGEDFSHESYWYDFNGTGEGSYPFGLDESPCPDSMLVVMRS